MCDIHAVGKMAGKLSAERDTFMKQVIAKLAMLVRKLESKQKQN